MERDTSPRLQVLLELSDSELESGLGISHPMHRKKLRLAIEELREPRLTRFPRISALNHTWVSSEWLPDLGLPQYADAFANNLVDGRLLEALTKKELEKHLGVHRKFHQASIIHGVHLLRIVRFDRQVRLKAFTKTNQNSSYRKIIHPIFCSEYIESRRNW